MVKTYQGDFKSFNGNTYTVEIWYSGGGGGTRDRIIQSIEIERQGEGDTLYDNPLRPSRCKFTMVAQSDADYSTWKGWYAFPEDSLTVAVYKGSDLHWCGRLLIDQTKFRRMDASKGYATAEFVAVDALNLIGNYDVDPTWFTIDSNRASGITLIRQILDQTGLPDFWGGSDVFIQDATSITNTTKASASVMDYIAFQEGAFIQNITPELKQAEIKYVNCKTALEMILTAFSARLQLQNGAYWLYNPQAYELTDITYDSYAKDGTKLANNSTAAHSYTVDSTTQRPKFEALPVYSWQAPVRLAEIDIDRRNYVTFEDSNATSTIASRTDIVAGTNYPLRVQGRVSFEPLSAAGYSYQYSVIYQLRITNGSAYKYWNEQNNTWSSSSYTIRRVIPNNNINEYSFSHDIVAPPTGYTTIAVIIEAVDYTAAYFTGGVWTSAASGGAVTTDYWVSICQAYTAAEPYEFEQKKTFTSTVTLAGNSQKVEKDCAFYNGKNSEIGGITVYNGSAWVTASVWSQGWDAATFDDLPQMVANNITSVYNKYLPTINLTLHDSGSYNELKSLYFDSQTWIFNGGTINLYDDTFSGEWIAIASDYSLIDTDGESDTTQKNANDNLYKQVVYIRLQQSRTDAVVGRLPDFLIEQIVNFGSRAVTADPGVDKKYPISIIYNYDATTPTMQFQIVEQPAASLDSVTLMKMADESKTSTDTLTDDDTFVVPMLASYLYRIKGVVAFSTSAVADYKFSFASPGSAFIGEVVISGDDGTGTLFRHTAFGTTQSVNVGSTSKYIVRFEAVVQNDVDRDFVFQWAQNTSDASATKVLAGSTIEWVSEAIITNILTAESGTYTMTGNDANFLRTYRLVAESGTYAMTGNDATLSKQYRLTAESGTYTMAGNDATLSKNLLLDVYTSAAVAYGFTKLRTAYSGYCIKIRRASDNTTQDIGFSGYDLDTSAINTFCSGTTGYIHTVYDQSGNGNNWTQTTAASQPLIYSGGAVRTLNSMPSANFDGTDDWFDLTTAISCAGPWTSMFVGKRTASGGKGLALSGYDSSHGYTPWRYSDNTVYMRGDSGYSASSSTYTTASQESLIGVYTSGGVSVWSNNSSIAMGSLSSATSSNFVEFGRRENTADYHAGDFQAFVLWLSDKSSDHSAIDAAIRAVFGF